MSALKKLYDTYRSIMLIGAAMGGSLIFYFILVKVLESRGIMDGDITYENSSLDLMRVVIYGASIMLAFTMSIVRGMMLRSVKGESIEDLVNKLFRSAIVTLALCEAPAILGLMLYFIGRLYFDFYILLAFSLVLFFFYFPRYERWKGWMEKKAGPNWEQENI
jgi:F0F1-type ATP synthase membrane subunit c/vacuolar-type H+-ATPase subunit K